MTAPNPGDYAHQCRYCAYCVFTMDERWWCDEINRCISAPKRANRCAAFLYNEIPADGPLEKKYTPRRKKDGVQGKLFGKGGVL